MNACKVYVTVLAHTLTHTQVCKQSCMWNVGGVFREGIAGEGWLVGAAEICPPAVMTDYPAGVALIPHTAAKTQPNPARLKPQPPSYALSPIHLWLSGSEGYKLDCTSRSVSVKYTTGLHQT